MTTATRSRAKPDLVRAEMLFHALSDATRLAILEMLRGGERCVCDLQDDLDAAQSKLSFHLKVLKDARLVVARQEGNRRIYQLDPEGVALLRAYLDRFWSKALTAYKAAVEKQAEED